MEVPEAILFTFLSPELECEDNFKEKLCEMCLLKWS